MTGAAIVFLATSKSGLGHLRRVATIAGRVRALGPDRPLHLVTNAPPQGLSPADLSAFASVRLAERAEMAGAVETGATLVLDTLTVPGIEAGGGPLALILREAPEAALDRFRLDGGRPWDLVLVANPQAHWMPPEGTIAARRLQAVGWIYRPTGRREGAGGPAQLLVATGGGGTAETSADLYARIDAILDRVPQPPAVVQAIGPRAQGFGRLSWTSRTVDPGPDLNALFRQADLVISTAGYNSVLELATTDTPTLLIPIPRSIDDQVGRARLWGPRLGAWHDGDPAASARWLAAEIAARRRRPPVDLGPSGEDAAARAILSL